MLNQLQIKRYGHRLQETLLQVRPISVNSPPQCQSAKGSRLRKYCITCLVS